MLPPTFHLVLRSREVNWPRFLISILSERILFSYNYKHKRSMHCKEGKKVSLSVLVRRNTIIQQKYYKIQNSFIHFYVYPSLKEDCHQNVLYISFVRISCKLCKILLSKIQTISSTRLPSPSFLECRNKVGERERIDKISLKTLLTILHLHSKCTFLHIGGNLSLTIQKPSNCSVKKWGNSVRFHVRLNFSIKKKIYMS